MDKIIKVLIVDDEFVARDYLRIMLEEHCPELDVVSDAENVDDAIQKIIQFQPDIVFLDIQLSGKLGFDLFDKFEEINFEVIFVTGYSDYVLEAFQVSAVGYLLKPLDPLMLITAVKNAKKRLKQKQFSQRYRTLINNAENIGTDNMKLVVSNSEGFSYLDIRDIIRCEGWDKYTYLHCTNGKRHLCSKNIGHYIKILEPIGFFIAHKSHLIQPKYISSFNGADTITMNDNSVVPLARRRKKIFQLLLSKLNL